MTYSVSTAPTRTSKISARVCTAISLIVPIAFALAAGPVRAGNSNDPGAPLPEQIDLTRATGMAGAMTAFASGNDAITVNPAGLALNHSYHFQVDGMDDVKFPAEGVILSIADSTALGIGSGMIFERFGAGQYGFRTEGWLAGISYAYQQGAFLFGGTTHLIHFAEPAGVTVHSFAEDLGVMAKAGSFQFGATLQNVNLSFENMPLFPLTTAFGIAYGDDSDFHLSADYKIDLTDTSNLKHQLSFGGELLLDKTLVLRSGYRWDVTDHLGWLTFGASIVTQNFAIGAALRRRIDGAMEQALEASITIFLE